MIRIALTDDHTIFRKSLRVLINTFEDCEVVLEASNGLELERELDNTNIDVLILDIQMPEQNGIITCKNISEQHPDIKILILSQLESKEMVLKMIQSGAAGYFTKNTNPENLEKAIKDISNDGFYFDKNLGAVIRQALIKNKETKLVDDRFVVDFSDRELEIIQLISEQKNNLEIAKILDISQRTVETYRKRMIEKTESKNIIGVLTYAVRNNMIVLSDELE